MRKGFFILFTTILLLFPVIANAEEFNIKSNNAILYNVEEDKVMYEKNPNEKSQIASLTKVVSALVILDHEKDLNKKIDFKKVNFTKLAHEDLSISSLNSKKSYTCNDLLHSFVMESAADSGYALVYDVSKTEKDFVILMNEKAKEIGMTNSKFSNAVGLDDINNYSTMSDMLKLMKYALNNKTLKEIMSTFTYKTEDGIKVNHTFYFYINHFKLHMDYVKGGKTGYNTIPGFALMSYANKNGSTYILVTTNAPHSYTSPNHFKDAKLLYEYYFNNYSYHNLVNKNDVITKLNTKYLKEKNYTLTFDKDIKYFSKNDFNKADVKIKYKGIRTITPFTKKGKKIGTASIYYKDKLIEKTDVVFKQKKHFSITKFVKYNKNIIIAIISYIMIIIGTIIIVRKIKTKKR